MSGKRFLNIAVRTAHIAVTGILLGGHVFDAPVAMLRPFLWLSILTGGALVAIEAGPRLLWLHQGRGLFVLAKLALLLAVLAAWEHRVALLIGVVVLASFGSHMPAKFRYYSVLRREMVKG